MCILDGIQVGPSQPRLPRAFGGMFNRTGLTPVRDCPYGFCGTLLLKTGAARGQDKPLHPVTRGHSRSRKDRHARMNLCNLGVLCLARVP